MKSLSTFSRISRSVFILAALAACGPSSGRPIGSSPASGNGAACQSQSDCPAGQACLSVGGVSACALSCSASANECSGMASCGNVGSVSASYCRPASASSSADAQSAPTAEEQPRIPCRADSECAAVQSDAVCGAFRGARDCTIRCTTRSQCNPPAIGGVATNFLDCVTDEADPSRRVCVPDPACFQASNPYACVSLPGAPQDPFADAGF